MCLEIYDLKKDLKWFTKSMYKNKKTYRFR